jgi:hypothetical protein
LVDEKTELRGTGKLALFAEASMQGVCPVQRHVTK